MISKLSELVAKAGVGAVSEPDPLPISVTVRLPYRIAVPASRASMRMGVARAQLVRDWAEVGMEAMKEALGPDRWSALVCDSPTCEEEAREWEEMCWVQSALEHEEQEGDK